MQVTFLGVGEACDPHHGNTSILVEGEAGRQLLLDCGFTVPHRYFALSGNPEKLAGIWISHFHADHFFGLPLLLLRLQEMGRRGRLVILGPSGVDVTVRAAGELAYPGHLRRLAFQVDCVSVEPGAAVPFAGWTLRSAESDHSMRNLALRVDTGDASLYYSGDGRPTADGIVLARGCALAVQEAFRVTGDTRGHGSVAGALRFAREAGVAALALVHLAREDRKELGEGPGTPTEAGMPCRVFVPVEGDVFRSRGGVFHPV